MGIDESNYNYASDFFVVNRTMPKKIPGYEVYLNVAWTDVAIQNLPRESIGKVFSYPKNETNGNHNIDTVINDTYTMDKITPSDIITAETIWKSGSGEGKFTRKRKVPIKKSKKYPTKKKNSVENERKMCRFDKYSIVNNYGE